MVAPVIRGGQPVRGCVVAGEVIAGRYVLCDPIGVGGSGTVWRAYDRQRAMFCAAKLLRQRDAGELLRFAREQAVRLSHPRVVSPYAWAADDGMVLIVSELIDGGSLHTLLGDYGPLSDGTVVDVLDQVLDALGAVHDAQLIHRDVKPGNLLLRSGSGRLQVLLADFGLTIGVRDARLTEVGTVIGTPGYLPPEVLAGGVPPDIRHDLYAVGRLALALLAGGESAGVTGSMSAITDPTLRRTVTALVAADPQDRPVSAAAARELLRTARREDRPHTRDGDPISVLPQLPPIPESWSPAQEAPAIVRPAAVVPGRSTRVDDVPTEVVPAAVPIAGVGAGHGGHPPSARPSRTARRRRWLGAAAALVAVAAGAAALITTQGSDGTADDRGVPPTGGPTSGSAPVSPQPDATVAAAAGEPCDWQREGDRGAGTAGGVITCALVDGAYVWTAG